MAGSVAGSCDGHGHILIRIDGFIYRAHRLAWLIMTGSSPKILIDHINGDPSDNRWSNLRLATKSENGCNSKVRSHNRSGIKGVRRLKSGKWNARIVLSGVETNIGSFLTIEEARAAYAEKAASLHGQFARLD